jgi:glycosyltransferase involved in cell wall biosynthesis
MKILFINDNYFSIGGANIANRNLVKFLLDKKIDVSLITCSYIKRPVNHINIYTLPTLISKYPSFIAIPYVQKINYVISKENPDIIHLQVPTPISLIALWLARRKKIPVVIGIHELPKNISIYSPVAKSLITKLIKKILAYGLEKTNVSVAPSEFAKRYYKKLAPKSDIRVISNGTDIDTFKHSYSKAILFKNIFLSHLDSNLPIILFVGRIMPDKNLEILIKAIEGINVIVVLVGNIWQSYIKNLNLLSRRKVIITGWVSKSILIGAYSAADIFVQPSTSELQSLAILEAMSCGLPIIGVNYGPIPELVIQDLNGLLFEPYNFLDLREKIRSLLNNKSTINKMQKESLRIVQKHSLIKCGEEYIKVYNEISQGIR